MKKFETPVASGTLTKDRMLTLRIKGGVEFDLTMVKAHLHAIQEHSENQRLGVLIDIREVSYSDVQGDVLKYMADNEFSHYQAANAILVKNVSMRIMVGVYLDRMNTQVPARAFSDEKKALAWLEKCLSGESDKE